MTKKRSTVKVTDVQGYTYNADNYCPNHVVQAMGYIATTAPWVEDQLNRLADVLDVDREDERSFDSGDFPKVILNIDAISEDEDPEDGPFADRCGTCGEVLGR